MAARKAAAKAAEKVRISDTERIKAVYGNVLSGGVDQPAACHRRLTECGQRGRAGLLVYPQAAHLEHFEPRKTRQLMTGTGGYMARVGQWLRESF